MAITAGDIYVRSGNTGAFTKAEFVQGGWITVTSGSDMIALDPTRLSDGQIVYVRSEQKTYVCNYFTAFVTPGYSGFANSASFSEFYFPTTAGVGADITAVTAGDGLSGGATSGEATLNLDTGSTHFTNALSALNTAGVFKATGSYYSTTNNLQVTGSLTMKYDGSTDPFKITSASLDTFTVTGEGVLQLISQSDTPSAREGGIYFGSDGNFYFGS
jgi:hypothetical protein